MRKGAEALRYLWNTGPGPSGLERRLCQSQGSVQEQKARSSSRTGLVGRHPGVRTVSQGRGASRKPVLKRCPPLLIARLKTRVGRKKHTPPTASSTGNHLTMKENDRIKLGKRLAEIRRLRGYKQIEVCLDTGIKPHQLSRAEGGGSHLKYWEALELFTKYRCSVKAFDWKLPLGDVGGLFPPDGPPPAPSTPLPPDDGQGPGGQDGDRTPIP